MNIWDLNYRNLIWNLIRNWKHNLYCINNFINISRIIFFSKSFSFMADYVIVTSSFHLFDCKTRIHISNAIRFYRFMLWIIVSRFRGSTMIYHCNCHTCIEYSYFIVYFLWLHTTLQIFHRFHPLSNKI